MVDDDDTKKISRSSSISSSSSGEDFFQLEISNLGTATISLKSGDNETNSPLPQSTNPSVSPAGRNSHGQTFKESENGGDDAQLMLEETDDIVPTEMTFKANHSALDYSYVSRLENNSNYAGFAKQSLASQANSKAEAYDPNRIPASIFGKPQAPQEWSAASTDAIQDKQQKATNGMSAPQPVTMTHASDTEEHSAGTDEAKATETEQNANQAEPNGGGSWLSCSCLTHSFSS